MSIIRTDPFSKEAASIAELFSEDIEMNLYNLDGVATYKVMRVNGHKPSHRITVCYYYDQACLSSEIRDSSKALRIHDDDVIVRYGQTTHRANIEARVISAHDNNSKHRYAEDRYLTDDGSISLRDLLIHAYQLGGYGDRYELLNSDHVSLEDAQRMADQALGLAD